LVTKSKYIETGLEKLDYYTKRVLSGKINVCRWVRLAVERHFYDLGREETEKFPYFFDSSAAQHFFDFCEDNLYHYEGIMQGKPLILEPWQWFVYGSIFGWRKQKKFGGKWIRRFRTAIIIVPKKNGKSILSGAVALYMLEADNWPGAQCYTLAKNQTHAKDLGYRSATIMAENSPTLKHDYKVNRSAAGAGVYCNANNSFYKPITSKPDSEDGRNVHFCGPDEIKDWTDWEIYEVMKNGTVNAPNSLFMSTTTAGHDLLSLGYDRQKYLEKVLKGDLKDDTTFGVIYTIDDKDKKDKRGKIKENWWCDLKILKKTNPNYEISVFEDALKSLIIEAKQSPSKKTAFQTKHLNIWHTSSEDYIPEEKWNKCGKMKILPVMKNMEKVLEPYYGRRCFGGLDLGSVSDFTSFILEFIEPYEVLCFFWIPGDTIADRKGSRMIQTWVDQGHIGTTDGDWTDHDHIEETIKKIIQIVDIQEIAYDRYRMDQMVTHLIDEGIEMVGFGQGYVSMNPATDTLENSILQEEIEHFGNPVLAWMNGNITIKKDPAGNRKFDKDKSYDKIDGIVALSMAHNRATINQDETSSWSELKTIDID